MKKLLAIGIIINVFLSSIFLLVEKQNGVFSIVTSESQPNSDDSNDSKNPLYTELKSEKEDSKSTLNFDFKKLSLNPILIQLDFSQISKLILYSSCSIENNVSKNIPVYLLNRSFLI